MKIKLIESCASDLSVVNAARVSFAQEVEELSEGDEKLIGFLMRKRHGTPFEHGFFRFHVEAPIFVFREWHRHRVGHSYNEMSGRYVELKEKFFFPDEFRTQTGKPGNYAYEPVPYEIHNQAITEYEVAYKQCWRSYQNLLELGIAKEHARAVLPLGIYSQMHWSCNPRSLMHFLGLRNKPDAQKEIRDLAAEAMCVFEEIMPITASAFVRNKNVAP